MKMPDDITMDDLHAWLGGCWAVDADGSLIRFHGTTDDDELAIVTDVTGERHVLRPLEIEPWWPNLGAINVEGSGALYLSRRPRRQWRRSYFARHVARQVLGGWRVENDFPTTRLFRLDADTKEVVSALHSPWYPRDAYEAMDYLLNRDVPSVAVSRSLTFVRTKTETGAEGATSIYYNQDHAGRLRNERATLTLTGAPLRRVTKMLGGMANERQ